MFNKQSILNKYSPATQTTERVSLYGNPTTTANAHSDAGSTAVKNESKPTSDMPATTRVASVTQMSDDGTGNSLVVGPNVKLKGAEIDNCDILVVEGRVEATMDSRVLRVAENGAFAGKVGIDVAEIHGRFDGELTARSQLIIHATGRVSGTIRYGKILIEEGGELSGDVCALSSDRDRVGEAAGRRRESTSLASGITPSIN